MAKLYAYWITVNDRDTLREAFRVGLVVDGNAWMQMIQDRNLTSNRGVWSMSGSFHCKHAVPGLPAEASDRLLTLLGRDPAVEQVWLYGSRAMARHRPASDIDLTLKGPALSHEGLLPLMAAVDDLLLPWQVDLSLYAGLTADLRAHVDRVGLLLLERVPSAPGAMPR